MQLRPARMVLHVVAATSLATGGLFLVGPSSPASASAHPDVYGGDSTASSLHVLADRNPQPTPVSDAFHDEVPYATSSLDSSGTDSSSAASFYPGAGPLGVPALLCQFASGICGLPVAIPDYPLLASAEYPTRKDESAAGQTGTVAVQGVVTAAPGVTTAHADPERVESSSETGSSGIAGVLTAQSARSHSKQVFVDGALVVAADSLIRDVDIAGQLHIDSVRSTVTAVVDGAGKQSARAMSTVTGATLAGHPVTIDSTGIHADGQGDGGALGAGVNTALKAFENAGLSARLLTPDELAKDGTARASCGGLLLTFTHTVALPAAPLPSVPIPGGVPGYNGDYVGSVSLAGAGVTAFAAGAEDFGVPQIGPLPGIGGPPAVSAPQTAVLAPVQPLTPEAPSVQSPVAGPASGPAISNPASSLPRKASFGVAGLSDKQLTALALLLLGYPVLVLLGGVLHAPARLPRP